MAGFDKKLLKASKYIQKQQYKKAVRLYKNLLKAHGNDPKILNKLGDTYLKMDKIDKAMKVFKTVAEFYEKKSFYQNAIALYKKMLREKNDVDLKLKIADLYVKVGSESEAEYYYNEYSEYYMRQENVQKAIPAYKKIVDINPDNMELKRKLAGIYYMAENYKKMFEIYQEVFNKYLKDENEAKLKDVFNTVSAIAKDKELFDNNIYFVIFNDYIKYLYKHSEKDLASNTALDMANTLYDKGDYEKSEKLLRTILDKDRSKVPARIKLIEIYKETGEKDKLVEEYLNMGNYLKDKNPERAKVIYKEVLKHDPNNEDAKKALGKKKKIKKEKSKKEQSKEDKLKMDISDVDVSKKDDMKDKLKMEIEEKDEKQEDMIEAEDLDEGVKVDDSNIESGKESYIEDEDVEFEVEIEGEEKSKTEELETALQDLFTDYTDKSSKNKSLLTDINKGSKDNLIPKIDDVIVSFKKGIEEQLGGDPQNRYDMAIGFKEMGLIDSAIEEFRKLASINDYRIKSLNLLAQCLIEKGEYESAIEEFHEVMASEKINQNERDAILYNIAIAYFKQQSYAQAYEYINKIENTDVFKNDNMYNKIYSKLEEVDVISSEEEIGIEEEITEKKESQDEISILEESMPGTQKDEEIEIEEEIQEIAGLDKGSKSIEEKKEEIEEGEEEEEIEFEIEIEGEGEEEKEKEKEQEEPAEKSAKEILKEKIEKQKTDEKEKEQIKEQKKKEFEEEKIKEEISEKEKEGIEEKVVEQKTASETTYSQADMSKFKSALKILRKRIEKQNENEKENKEKISELKEEIHSLKKLINNKSKEDISDYKNEVSEIKSSIKKYDDKIKNIDDKFEIVEELLESKENQKEKLSDVNKMLDKFEDKYSELNKQIKEIDEEDKVSEIYDKLKNFEDKFENYDDNHEELSNKVYSIEDKVNDNLEKYDKRIDRIDDNLDNSIKDFNEKLNEINEKITKLENNGKEYKELDNKISQYEDKMDEFNNKLDEFDSKIEELEGIQDREKNLLNQFIQYKEDFDIFSDKIKQLEENFKEFKQKQISDKNETDYEEIMTEIQRINARIANIENMNVEDIQEEKEEKQSKDKPEKKSDLTDLADLDKLEPEIEEESNIENENEDSDKISFM